RLATHRPRELSQRQRGDGGLFGLGLHGSLSPAGYPLSLSGWQRDLPRSAGFAATWDRIGESMEAAWFAVIGFMLVIYVGVDGFDFGAGILHLLIAKTDEERRTVLAAIGPFWDGNEVWLVAAGGVLVFAFPRVYAAAFSGFYLPLTMVLWLLILRGLSIEFRSHHDNPLWRNFWDASFAFASVLIAAVLGASLGNLIRGVPLDSSGYFRAVLFTNFRTRPEPGALDWYTILVGLFAVAVLAGHGAVYLWWKASGTVADRAERLAKRLWVGIAAALLPVTVATAF